MKDSMISLRVGKSFIDSLLSSLKSKLPITLFEFNGWRLANINKPFCGNKKSDEDEAVIDFPKLLEDDNHEALLDSLIKWKFIENYKDNTDELTITSIKNISDSIEKEKSLITKVVSTKSICSVVKSMEVFGPTNIKLNSIPQIVLNNEKIELNDIGILYTTHLRFHIKGPVKYIDFNFVNDPLLINAEANISLRDNKYYVAFKATKFRIFFEIVGFKVTINLAKFIDFSFGPILLFDPSNIKLTLPIISTDVMIDKTDLSLSNGDINISVDFKMDK